MRLAACIPLCTSDRTFTSLAIKWCCWCVFISAGLSYCLTGWSPSFIIPCIPVFWVPASFCRLFLQLSEWALISSLTLQHVLSPSQLCAIQPCGDQISTFFSISLQSLLIKTPVRIRLKSQAQRTVLHRLKQMKWKRFQLWITEDYSSDTSTDAVLELPCIPANYILITSTSSEMVSKKLCPVNLCLC